MPRLRRLPPRAAVGRLALAALAATAATAATAVAPAAAAPVNGIQIARVGQGDPAADLRTAKTLGAKIVRAEVRWDDLEPDAAGVRDPALLAQADTLMRRARASGVKVLLVVAGTPCWASAAPAVDRGDCTTAAQRATAAAYPPADPKAFAAVAGFLAGRFRTSLAAFEVWNEPDQANEKYFAGPDKPQRYTALLKAAYPAIKRAAPGVPVLGGSLVGSNGAFLQAMYRAGAKGFYDALSLHFYDLPLNGLRATRRVQRANGDRKPVWLAEYGWTSCAPARTQGGQNCVTRAQQGRSTTDIVRALARTAYVDAAILYTLRDDSEYDFGVLDRAGARKPAFGVVQRAFTRRGTLRPVTLQLARAGGRLVASGSAPAGDTLELDAFQGTALRLRIVFRLDRDGRYRLTLPSAIHRGMVVQVGQYWSGRHAVRRVP